MKEEDRLSKEIMVMQLKCISTLDQGSLPDWCPAGFKLCVLCDFAVNYFFILTNLFVSSGEPVRQSFRRDATPYLLQVWDNIQVLKKELGI